MNITKYEHACLVVEEGGRKLVIDPGVYSASFNASTDIDGVVVTHVHGDHLDIDKLKAIAASNPQAVFFGTQEVVDEVGGVVPITAVTGGDAKPAGGFKLEFFGTDHAIIHENVPVAQNVGVMVNDILYYPGDSFTVPHRPVQVLAAPAGSPWAKVGEEMDFITAIKAKQVFPTHNAMLSEIGSSGRDNWLSKTAESVGTKYIVLRPGESLSV